MRHLVAMTMVTWALVAAAAEADWLVTREGAKVETKGPWTVKGRMVVFTRANGALSSMRLDEVDIGASETATADALKPPAVVAEPAAKKEAVLVLTNEDIPSRAPEPAAVEGEEGAAPAGDSESAVSANGPVEVVSYQEGRLPQGIEIQGTVRNAGTELAVNISVSIELVALNGGEVLAQSAADLGAPELRPGESTRFGTTFPGIEPGTTHPRIRVTSIGESQGAEAESYGSESYGSESYGSEYDEAPEPEPADDDQ